MLYTIEPAYTKDELLLFEEVSNQLVEEVKKNKWKHEKEIMFDGTDREKIIGVLSDDELTGIVVWSLDPANIPDERKKPEFQLQVEIWAGKKESTSEVDFNLEIKEIVALDKDLIMKEIVKLLDGK